MGIVIIGHGELDVDTAAVQGVVAVGPGTTLQYYSDFGQGLYFSKEHVHRTLREHAAPWAPLTQRHVTYNFRLEPIQQASFAEEGWLPDGKLVSEIEGHDLYVAGLSLPCGPILCDGDATICPTDPRMLTGEVEGPSQHSCEGVLAEFQGQEIHWLACTSLESGYGWTREQRDLVRIARGQSSASATLGTHPDDLLASYSRFEGQAFWRELLDLPPAVRSAVLAHPELRVRYVRHVESVAWSLMASEGDPADKFAALREFAEDIPGDTHPLIYDPATGASRFQAALASMRYWEDQAAGRPGPLGAAMNLTELSAAPVTMTQPSETTLAPDESDDGDTDVVDAEWVYAALEAHGERWLVEYCDGLRTADRERLLASEDLARAYLQGTLLDESATALSGFEVDEDGQDLVEALDDAMELDSEAMDVDQGSTDPFSFSDLVNTPSREALSDLDEDGTTTWSVYGLWVLIGATHDVSVIRELGTQDAEGDAHWDGGSLRCLDVPANLRSTVTQYLKDAFDVEATFGDE